MTRLIVLLSLALVAAPLLSILLGNEEEGLFSRNPDPIVVPAGLTDGSGDRARTAVPSPPPPAFTSPEEEAVYDRAARLAWRYVSSQTNESTGIPNSVIGYPFATVWDMASAIAAIYAARQLALIDEAEYDRRIAPVLRTLSSMRLFDEAAFNKNYQVARGVPAGRNDRERPARADGYGWSVVDIGRLLVWLKIIERSDPEHAGEAAAIVARLDLDRLMANGYLQGGSMTSAGTLRLYQEGRVGYEQYAAAGFSLWGRRAERALNWEGNVEEVDVLGVSLLADERSGAFLTSEPFLLMGMELGWWDPRWEVQAERILAAQEARFEETRQLTMASEDALPVAPYYFYYYTLHDDGEAFAIRSLGSAVPSPAPRWVSTKAAFGWYALMPGPYTWRAVRTVSERAGSETLGWSSGLYERTGEPTGSQNINTAAMVLEAALYRRRREPLIAGAGRPWPVAAPRADSAGLDGEGPPAER